MQQSRSSGSFFFVAALLVLLLATLQLTSVDAIFMSPRDLFNIQQIKTSYFDGKAIRLVSAAGGGSAMGHFDFYLQQDGQATGVFGRSMWVPRFDYAILMRTVGKCVVPQDESYPLGVPYNMTSLCFRKAVGDLSYYLEEQAVLTDGTLLLNSAGTTFNLDNGDKFLEVACGRAASAAVTEQGKVYVWGDRSKKLSLAGPTKPTVLDAFGGKRVVSHGGASSFFDSDSTFAFITEDGSLYVSAPSYDTTNRTMLLVPTTQPYDASNAFVRVADYDKFFVFNKNSLNYDIIKINGNATTATDISISSGTITASDLGLSAPLSFSGFKEAAMSDYGGYGVLLLANDAKSLVYLQMNYTRYFGPGGGGGGTRQRIDSIQYSAQLLDLSVTFGSDAKFSGMSTLRADMPYGNGIVLYDARDGSVWILGYADRLLWERLGDKQIGQGVGLAIAFQIPLIFAACLVSLLTCVRNRTPLDKSKRASIFVSLSLKALFFLYSAVFVIIQIIRAVYIVDAGFNGAQITLCNPQSIIGVVVVMLLPLLFTFLIAIPLACIRCCKARACLCKPSSAGILMAFTIILDVIFIEAFGVLCALYLNSLNWEIPVYLPVLFFIINWITGTLFLLGSTLAMESWLSVPWLVKKLEKAVQVAQQKVDPAAAALADQEKHEQLGDRIAAGSYNNGADEEPAGHNGDVELEVGSSPHIDDDQV